jgi:pantothenate kinase-related protein Tda10
MPTVHLQSDNSTLAPTIDIEAMGHKWTLNREQLQAFRIITEHSLHQQEEPLRMFISGPAETGKTRVINVVKDYFEQRGQTRHF